MVLFHVDLCEHNYTNTIIWLDPYSYFQPTAEQLVTKQRQATNGLL